MPSMKAVGRDEYELRWEGALQANGQRTQRKRRFRGGINAAKKELERLVAIEATVAPPCEAITFGEWLDRWVATKALRQLEVQTVRAYETHVRSIKARLGEIPLLELTHGQINDYYTWAMTHGRVQSADSRGDGLSRTTLHHHHVIIRAALKQAVNERRIEENPTDRVIQPEMERKRMPALQMAQVIELTGAARNTLLYVPIVLSLYATLREGEVLALRWKDVDLEHRFLRVDESAGNAYPHDGGGMAFKAPKTRKGRRAVPLADLLVMALERHHRLEQAAGRGRPEDLVVCMEDGRPMRNDYLVKQFRKLRERLAWPENITFHCLRRTCATVLAHAGVAPSVLQDLMGHENAKTTLDYYTGVVNGAMQAAVGQFDRYYGEERQ